MTRLSKQFNYASKYQFISTYTILEILMNMKASRPNLDELF